MIDTADPALTDASDAELLGEFARSRSHSAFKHVVDRYVNLVHAAARRQVNDPHLAEDVTQAVFLLLSQRAESVSAQGAVGGWLLLTTRNVARNALKREWRLKRREQEAAKMNSERDVATTVEADAIAPMLDDALARLAADDRNAIVARFFHGGSHRDVGRELGVSEQAATKRVSRALAKLRAILERQGVTASEATLSAVLPAIALKPAASVALVSSVVGTASAAAPPAAVAALAKGAAAGSALTGTTIATGTGLVAVIAAGTYFAVATLINKPPAPPIAPQSAAPVVVAAAPEPRAVQGRPVAPAAVSRTVTLSIVDSQSSAPLADAQVQLEVDNGKQAPVRADANGKYVLNLPGNYQYARAIVSSPGRAQMSIEFPNQTFKGQLLSDYTVPMETGTKIGGIVVDESGEPVIGATVLLSSYLRGAMDQPRPILRGEKVQTGVDGKWTFDLAPSDMSLIAVDVTHPDYPKNQPYADAAKDDLRRGVYRRELKWQVGKSLDGVVMDADGKPLKGVTLQVCSDRYESNKPKATSDEAGKFHITGIEPRWQTVVTATMPGFAPQQVKLPSTVEDAGKLKPYNPIEVKLDKGVPFEGIVLDAAEKPLNGAKVEVEKWRDNRALTWTAKTDSHGHFVWPNAPAEAVQFNVSKKNFATLQGFEVKIAAGAEPVKLTIYAPVHITGNVIDAETKQPIPAFRVVDGIRWTGQADVTWQSMNARSLSNGVFVADITSFSNGGKLRVEADGYLPTESRMIAADEGSISLNFELKKGSGPTGQVVDADGKPVIKARVIGIPDGTQLYMDLENGNLDEQEQFPVARTDKDGRFRLRPMDKKYSLLAFGDEGLAILKQDDVPADGVIKLNKWARIEGDLRMNASPLANMGVTAQPMEIAGQQINTGGRQSITDAAGHFVIDKIPPNAHVRLYHLVPLGGGSTRYRELGQFDTKPDQTTKVKIGGHGRPVIAKVILPQASKDQVDWMQQLVVQEDHSASVGSAVISLLKMTQPGAANRPLPGLDFIQKADGTIRAEDVEPGTYNVRAVLRQPWDSTTRQMKMIGTATLELTVPETPACPTDEPLDIGTIQLQSP